MQALELSICILASLCALVRTLTYMNRNGSITTEGGERKRKELSLSTLPTPVWLSETACRAKCVKHQNACLTGVPNLGSGSLSHCQVSGSRE